MSKRTLRGTKIKAIRKSGFRARMSNSKAAKVIKARRRKGRKVLTKALNN